MKRDKNEKFVREVFLVCGGGFLSLLIMLGFGHSMPGFN
jgi:hypothetical protein